MGQRRIGTHMRDVCTVGTAGSTTAPSPGVAFSYGSSIRCRYARVSTRDVPEGAKVSSTDAKIFLPNGTAIRAEDRIRLSKLNGSVLGIARNYAVVGEPHETGGRVVVMVKRLIGESEA